MSSARSIASRKSVFYRYAASLLAVFASTCALAQIPQTLDALVSAAKAEGQMTFYSAAAENVGQRIATAFTAKYGVTARFVRLTSATLQQRFAAEAEAGNIAMDLGFLAGNASAFADDGIKKGWVESVSAASLPVMRSGEFPARFNRGSTSVIQIAPWLIFYNTEKIRGADIPKDWPDLLDPKWKGQVLLADPRVSDAHIDLWTSLLDRYGESFFTRLRAQNLRLVSGSGTAAVQALAAGESSVAVPSVAATVQGIKEKGGPVEVVMPAYTTGVEMQVMLTARAKAKNPNAARLMANYVMSLDGNKVFNDDPGSLSIYDTRALPKDYQAPKPGAVSRKDLILKLLGL